VGKALEIARRMTLPIPVVAFSLVFAAFAFWLALRSRKRGISWMFLAASIAIVVLGLAPSAASTYLGARAVYPVSIEVLGPDKQPVVSRHQCNRSALSRNPSPYSTHPAPSYSQLPRADLINAWPIQCKIYQSEQRSVDRIFAASHRNFFVDTYEHPLLVLVLSWLQLSSCFNQSLLLAFCSQPFADGSHDNVRVIRSDEVAGLYPIFPLCAKAHGPASDAW